MSTAYRRMILINESEYNNLQKTSTTAPLRGREKKLPIDQEQKIHAHALEEERQAVEREEEDKAVKTPLQQQQQQPVERMTVAFIKSMIEKFPLHARVRANAILQKLIGADISWDKDGQIILTEGEPPLPDSSVIDLIYYAANEKVASKQLSPVGWANFNKRLSSLSSRLTASPPPTAGVSTIKRKLKFSSPSEEQTPRRPHTNQMGHGKKRRRPVGFTVTEGFMRV